VESEAEQLKRQIEQEYQTANSELSGIAASVQHAFITKRMEQVAILTDKLQQVADEREVREFLRKCKKKAAKLIEERRATR